MRVGMSTDARERQMKHSKKWGVQAKILLVFTAINILATAAYTLFVYQIKTDSIYEATDARLTAAAHAVTRMLPADYLEQPLNTAPPANYLQQTRSLYAYSQEAGLRYVYAFVEDHGQVRYLADSASADEIRRDKYGQYMQAYREPPPALWQAFRDGQPHFAEYQDQFGQFRSLFVPGERRDGLRYVIGADIDVAYLQNRSHEALLTSLLIGGAIFAISLALSWWVARALTQPVRALLSVTERLADGDYSARAHSHGQDEVAQLAGGLNAMGQAIAQREEAMLQLIYRDELTGLGNRLALDEALTAALSQHQMGVLMLVHLDRFRAINDLLGFAAGDLVLQVATTRLSELWPNDSRVHRLGGNVFALLVTGLPAYDSDSLHRQVFRALEGEPFTLADQQIDLTVTLGIVRFPQHGNQAGLLLRNAEVALYAAKQAHKPWSEYNAEQVGSRREQLSLLGELRRAVEQHEMHVFYQPQVSINQGQLVQAEALVRWRHPERGWVPPSAFIPFAEQTGRIRSLTDWLLNEVAQQTTAWRASGQPLTISINVAVHDLEDPDFPKRVAAALRRHDAQPQDLCLEITEGGLMADPEQARATLTALHEAGHRLAIDDFGTGYSSLAYLSHLPVDELKIDRSFIMDLNLHNRSIVLSTISLGHALGLKVVAEGVETGNQYRELALLGCDIAQGYLIAKALPLEEFNAWRHAHPHECDWGSCPDAAPDLPPGGVTRMLEGGQ